MTINSVVCVAFTDSCVWSELTDGKCWNDCSCSDNRPSVCVKSGAAAAAAADDDDEDDQTRF